MQPQPQDRKFLINYTGPDIYKKKTTNTIMRELTSEEKNIPADSIVLRLPNIKIFCDDCQKNVTMTTSIRTQEHDYCVGCFSQLEEFPEQYFVRKKMLFSLSEPEWTSLDEMLMLNALEKWGFGNWEEVQDFMNYNGGKFKVREIQEHYDHYYLSPLKLIPQISQKLFEAAYEHNDNSGFWKQSTENLQSFQKPKIKNNVLGFNPKRGDFQTEFDDKAQTLISEIEFKEDDTPQEEEYKLKLIEQYNRRLSQREKRKKFTIEHHILDVQYLFNQEYSQNRYEKEARNIMQPFTRFQSHTEHEKTVKLIAKSNQIKSLIGGLKKCRRKVDPQGRIEKTLEILEEKEKFKNQNPRKIFHFDKSNKEEDLIKQLQDQIEKEQQNENLTFTILQKMD